MCVCVHRVGSGHYTAYGSHEGRWYHFNDSTVTLTSEDTVRKAKAYILFYVERAGQADVDKLATGSTATNTPDMDAAAPAGVLSEVVSQDNVAADTDATEVELTDGAATQMDASDENAGGNTAALNEADKKAVTGRDTSDEAGSEEAL